MTIDRVREIREEAENMSDELTPDDTRRGIALFVELKRMVVDNKEFGDEPDMSPELREAIDVSNLVGNKLIGLDL